MSRSAGGESDDLKAIKQDRELKELLEEFWARNAPPVSKFASDVEVVAIASRDWAKAPLRLRRRALRILRRYFGPLEVRHLANLSAEKGETLSRLILRPREDSELPDDGKRRKENKQDYLDYLVGTAVYSRMLERGLSKEDAIREVQIEYRSGVGPLQQIKEVGKNLPDGDGIEKWLYRFRKKARERGYVDPFAAHDQLADILEPDLKIRDIPKRGRPPKK